MPMMAEVIQESLLFGSIFMLVLGLSYLFFPVLKIENYMMSIVTFCGTVIFLYAYLNYRGIFFDSAVLNHLYIPFVYLIGPALYYLFLAASYDDFQLDPLKLTTFLPGVGLFFGFLIYGWLDPGPFAGRPIDYFRGAPAAWPEILMVVGFATNVIYYFLLFKDASVVFNRKSLREETSARILFMMLLSTVVLTILLVAGYMLRNEELVFFIGFAASVSSAIQFIVGRRQPDLFSDLEFIIEEAREAEKDAERYKTSRLEGVDLKELQKNLDRLMRVEKIFLEDDLTLNKLADELGIKHYQLSEFLNSRLNMNFSRYVNHFRIEEAARILLEDREASVLSVAYQVGFNSKANFNLAFKSIKGQSPRQFVAAQSDIRG